MFLFNHFKIVTHPAGDKSIPKDDYVFAMKMFLLYLSNDTSNATEFSGLRSYATIHFHKRTEFDFHGDAQNGVPDWLDVFMMLHRLDTEMKEAPLEGLSVLIRGHYLYTVSGSWLVTSQLRARLAGLQGERQKGKGRREGLARPPRM